MNPENNLVWEERLLMVLSNPKIATDEEIKKMAAQLINANQRIENDIQTIQQLEHELIYLQNIHMRY